jgi:Transcriptional regulator/sugar kinase
MIGLELDDQHAVAVAVDEQGNILARAQADAAGEPGAAATRVLEQVQQATSTSPAPSIGIAAANPESPAIVSVVAQLAQRFGGSFNGHPAILSGTAAAAAEAWIGAARGVKDVVFFAVSQHAIGGVIRDGVAVTSARGRANSIAWLSLNPVEREDYRKRGVSKPRSPRRHRPPLIWRIKAGDRSRVQDAVNGDLSAITVDHTLDAARNGDGVAISVLRDTAKYLGMAAANLVVVADPEMLVLGGVMESAADLFLEPVRIELSRRLPKPIMDALRLEVAVLGADAASVGAARLAATRP